MDLGLKGKSAVITGGATGIGRAAADAFLEEGCRVAICGRRAEKLKEAQEQMKAKGFDVMTSVVDVTKYDELAEFADRVDREFGGIDIWINNAASVKHKPLVECEVEEFRAMIDSVLISVFSGCKIAAERMRKRGRGGVIMNASSFASLIPNAGRGGYSSGKAAVNSLTRVLAGELAKDKIRVLAYVPGMIRTELSQYAISKYEQKLLGDIPMRRFGEPEDLGRVIAFLASDAAAYINGTYVEIAGGKFCVQNPMYSYDG